MTTFIVIRAEILYRTFTILWTTKFIFNRKLGDNHSETCIQTSCTARTSKAHVSDHEVYCCSIDHSQYHNQFGPLDCNMSRIKARGQNAILMISK